MTGCLALTALLTAQTPEFQSTLVQVRSLFATVRQLQEATGWHICIEEPVWAQRTSVDASTRKSFHGNRVNPPNQDVIQLQIPTLRGERARPGAMSALLTAFNSQNHSVNYKMETTGAYSVIEASSVIDAWGRQVPATLILDSSVLVAISRRGPTGHLEALREAIQNAMGTGVVVDLDGPQIDTDFTGKIRASMPTSDHPDMSDANKFSWGMSAPMTARTALIDLLSHSLTTYDWNVFCQAGVNGPDECSLSLRPVSVQVIGASGKSKKRVVTFDRGSPDIELPPRPPE